MKIKVVKSKKSLKETQVVDVNGVVREESKCYKSVRISSLDSVQTVYFPILAINEPPENPKYQYVIEINGRMYTSSEAKWIDNKNMWVDVRRVPHGIGYYRKGEDLKLGTILKEDFKTVTLKKPRSNEHILCESDELATTLGYIPSKCSELYIEESAEDKKILAEYLQKRPYQLSIRTTHYADSSNPAFVAISGLYRQCVKKGTKEAKFFTRLLGGKTFGLEYETTQGNINPGKLGNLGLVPLIDGSIGRENYEYTTVIMEGEKGAMAIKEQCQALTEYSGVNSNCAFHVHVGNVADDRLTFVSLFALCSRIESEMYSLFPFYKQHEVAVMGKQKEYSRKLPNLGIDSNQIFNGPNYKEELDMWNSRLFGFYSCDNIGKVYNRKNRKINNVSTKWREKWHCPTRYYWVNFVSYLFNSSGTVEFRIHEPTVNFTKVAAFVLLVSAIVRYAEKYPKKVLMYKDKIRLSDIVEELRTNFGEIPKDCNSPFATYANSITDYLQEYISLRKGIFIRETIAAAKQAVDNQGNSFQVYQKLANNFIKEDSKFGFKASDGRFTLY